MDLGTYLTTPAPFGAPEWVFFIAQILVALAGVYLAFLHSDATPARGPALRRLGYALLALGALGVLVGALRLGGVTVFSAPYWITIVTVLDAALAIYALYYARAVLPAQVAALQQAGRSRGARPSPASRPAVQRSQPAPRPAGSEGAVPNNGAPRTTPAGGRRESRRERKRRNR